jgi:hypothetical protein
MKSAILLVLAAFGVAVAPGAVAATGAVTPTGAAPPNGAGALPPTGAGAGTESAIPTAFGKERYDDTTSQSPFVLATPPEPEKEEAKGPLKDLVVTGIGKLDDGQPLVFVQRIGEDRSMKFTGNEPNDEGLSVKLVKWGENWSKTSIVMRHGSDEAEIKFKDKPEPSGGIAAGGPAGRQQGAGGGPPPPIVPSLNRPGTIGNTGGVQKPQSITPNIPRPSGVQPGRGGGPIPQPNTSFRGSANLNPTAIPQPNAPQQQNGGAPRVRVRTINNR